MPFISWSQQIRENDGPHIFNSNQLVSTSLIELVVQQTKKHQN